MSKDNTPVILDQRRQLPCKTFALSPPDEEGSRVLTVESGASPDAFVFFLPEYICDSLKQTLLGGIEVPKTDLAKQILEK